MSDFDPTKPHETVVGFGFTLFKYVQDERYYNLHFMRVHPDTGNAWSERDEAAVEEIRELVEDGKTDPVLASAAKAAKDGVVLPTRIIARKKK